ncbi:TetR/AcrR family transcriptional regulator [Natrinema sp. 74]|uniref:TetR/AcrR family transcriptional regulator n=1 Tax=Natrinema sp. 74 TaxID=3384159 RepID=UPI0038D3A5F3
MSGQPETEQRIREAAFRALGKHGYADLSIKDIGEELGQNPSIIYHYFDSKDELLLSMLDVFVELFVGRQAERPLTDPEAELRRFVDQMLNPTHGEQAMSSPPADMETVASRVYVELWAHATWDSDFRRETTQVEERLRAALARILRAGIETDRFRPVDAEQTADHIFFLLQQGIHARTTTNRDDIERIRTLIDAIIADISRED